MRRVRGEGEGIGGEVRLALLCKRGGGGKGGKEKGGRFGGTKRRGERARGDILGLI